MNLKSEPTGLAGVGREGEGMRLAGSGVGGSLGRIPRWGLSHWLRQGDPGGTAGGGSLSCESGLTCLVHKFAPIR